MDNLRFLHIPKTAGKTFSYILVSQYGPQRSFRLTGDVHKDKARWQNLPEDKQRSKSLFICHSPLAAGIDKAENARIITFLRDPVNRVKSFCQHVYEGKSSYLVKKYPPYSFEPNALLKKGELEVHNLYVNMLVGGNPRAGDSLGKAGLSDSDLLDRAWKTLTEDLSCFGLLEHFDKSLLLFQKQLGWDSPPFYVILNKKSNQRRLQFSEQHIEKIKELNKLDIVLYERAKDYFLEKVAAVTEDELQSFLRQNRKNQAATRMKWLFFRIIGKLQMLSVE